MMYDQFGYPYQHYHFLNFGPEAILGASILGIIFLFLIVFSVAIKGFALWHAARRTEKWWFIALLIVNTFGIFELIYLIFVAKIIFVNKKIVKLEENNLEKKRIIMDLKPGIYKHFKGHTYELVTIAHHSDTLEEMVVYRGLYDSKEFGPNPVWVRPRSSFTDTVIVEGKEIPRFEYVGE